MDFVSLPELKSHKGFSFLIACLCRLSVRPSFRLFVSQSVNLSLRLSVHSSILSEPLEQF